MMPYDPMPYDLMPRHEGACDLLPFSPGRSAMLQEPNCQTRKLSGDRGKKVINKDVNLQDQCIGW